MNLGFRYAASGLLAAELGMLLAACYPPSRVTVKLAPSKSPAFYLHPDSSGEKLGLGITDFSVRYESESDATTRTAWGITTASMAEVVVDELVYGVVPPGFEETVHAEPLVVGRTYFVRVGFPGNMGVTFKYVIDTPEAVEQHGRRDASISDQSIK
jgi:hypothetical protein